MHFVLPDERILKRARAFFRRFAKGEFELMTTPLLIFEVANALWKAVRVGRIEVADALAALNAVKDLRIPTLMPSSARILELAHEHGRTVYTADKHLFKALEGKIELIEWIGEVG